MAGFLGSIKSGLQNLASKALNKTVYKPVQLTSYAKSREQDYKKAGYNPSSPKFVQQTKNVSVPKSSASLAAEKKASSSSKSSSSKSSSKSSSSKSSGVKNPFVTTAYADTGGASMPDYKNRTGLGFYGMGNFLLPEFGITEMLGGKSSSLSSAGNNAAALSSYLGGLLPYGSKSTNIGVPMAGAPAVQGLSTGPTAGAGTGTGGSYYSNQNLSSTLGALGLGEFSGAYGADANMGATDYLSSAQQGAEMGNEAEIAQINAANDRLRAMGEQQLSDLEREQASGLSDIERQRADLEAQVGRQKGLAETSGQGAVEQAVSGANQATRQTRNMLRGLGILASSAAGELLSRPTQELDRETARIRGEVSNRVSQLDDFQRNEVSKLSQQANDLKNKYTSMVNAIRTDLRFNEADRAASIRAASAALADRLSQIKQAAFTVNSQIQAEKRALAQNMLQIAAQNNPTLAQDYLSRLMQRK